jgi:uracil permease
MLVWQSVVLSMITLISIIVLTVVLKKGFISQIPILIGLIIGFVAALIIAPSTITKSDSQITGLGLLNWTIFGTLPHMDASLIPAAMLAIVPVALVTIPESSAHIFQLDLYVNDLAKKKGAKNYDIKDRLGDNLVGDGLGDMIASALGGPAGTNYGENISTSAVTRNFSVWVFGLTAILAVIFAFTPLSTFAGFLPSAVVNGASIYLFGVIAAQGITLMIEKKVDIFNPKNLAVIAVIFIIGIGGHYSEGNGFPLYTVGDKIIYLPALAAAALAGILLNLILIAIEKLTKTRE